MNNEKAVYRKKLVESKNRNKSVDHRMIYPTATSFDDMFLAAMPSTDKHPILWERAWVFDNPEDVTNSPLSSATIGPFCKVTGGTNLWVNPREHLLDTIKEKMVSVSGDELYFDIVHRGDYAVIVIRHHKITGHKLLAKISWASVPHQQDKLTTPS